MPTITSDTYVPITADGNYDVVNLKPGRTYGVKLSGTFETTTVSIQILCPRNGGYVALDDTDAAGIDGTGVTEFTIITPGTAIRLVAANTVTPPDIDFEVFQKGA